MEFQRILTEMRQYFYEIKIKILVALPKGICYNNLYNTNIVGMYAPNEGGESCE